MSRQDGPGGPAVPWWRANSGSLLAGAVLLAALSMSRGGLAAAGPLLRVLLPVGLVYLGWRMLRRKIGEATNDMMRKQAERMGVNLGGDGFPRGSAHSRDTQSGPVIDLCPRCGSYIAPGHKCRT